MPVLLGLVFAAAAVPAVRAQVTLTGPAQATAMSIAGLLLAGAYVCLLLALLATPLRGVLHAVFAPLGRMALTNYPGGTVVALAAAGPLGPPVDASGTAVLLTAGAVLAGQWPASTLRLRRFRMGPMEWLWRWATWLRRPALRAG